MDTVRNESLIFNFNGDSLHRIAGQNTRVSVDLPAILLARLLGILQTSKNLVHREDHNNNGHGVVVYRTFRRWSITVKTSFTAHAETSRSIINTMWRLGGRQTHCLRASASTSPASHRVEAQTIRLFHSSRSPPSLLILRHSKRIYGLGNSARNLSGLSSFQSDNDKDPKQDDNQRQPPSTRKRGLGQQCRASLSATSLVSVFPTQPSYRRRLLVTKAEDTDKQKEEAQQIAPTSKTQTIAAPTGSQPIKSMDPDFASYLSGEKNPIDRERIKKSKRERHGRKIALDNEKELLSHVAKIQTKRKEESRLKTVKNVNRALWGNVLICTAKFGAWLSSGSSAMLAEFIHSIVDCGNQSLLLVGLRHSSMVADRK